ncbi:RusA family crossover junction endodeoxyribonuclease [Clostridium akagii]|uniref:RusA family crossover junction endodeoxyribonuclease n=1 Tax=Clostridium akagii TaxID=91623 RepID=UPI00047D3F4D|nr:RusA family crossover junction endodeoxyribonuclease [Clostridium akagii]
MNKCYAKVIVLGSPITKSNFKLSNTQGRAILPSNSGKYHDRYALYEEEIAYATRVQNPSVTLDEALIAVLKVYYKSEKRHPDTNNITKSIFDGIEKSGLIINDAQIRRLVIEEFYDKVNPRFELELFGESLYSVNYNVVLKEEKSEKIVYSPPSNRTNKFIKKEVPKSHSDLILCELCNKEIIGDEFISANNGKMIICKPCSKKMF